MVDSQPSSSFANHVPYRPATNLVPPPSEHHSDHQQQSSRSVGSMFESFSETQALDSTSENDLSTIRRNGHWDPSMLHRIFSLPCLLNQSGVNDMVELRTPSEWRVFVHQRLLCYYSLYYKAAIQGQFQEATSRRFDLTLKTEHAEHFVRWLYSGKLSIRYSALDTEELFHLYIFADEKDILALRRDVMSELVKKEKVDLPYELVALATNSLLPSAPLYKFLLDWHVQHWIPSEAAQSQHYSDYEVLSKEFMHLVMCKLAIRARAASNPVQSPCTCCNSPCSYHEHAEYKEWLSTCAHFDGLSFDESPDGLMSSLSKPSSA